MAIGLAGSTQALPWSRQPTLRVGFRRRTALGPSPRGSAPRDPLYGARRRQAALGPRAAAVRARNIKNTWPIKTGQRPGAKSY